MHELDRGRERGGRDAHLPRPGARDHKRGRCSYGDEQEDVGDGLRDPTPRRPQTGPVCSYVHNSGEGGEPALGRRPQRQKADHPNTAQDAPSEDWHSHLKTRLEWKILTGCLYTVSAQPDP